VLRFWRDLGLPNRLALVGLVVALVGLIPSYFALRAAPESSSDVISEAVQAAVRNQRELSVRIDTTSQEVQQLRSEVNSLKKPTSQGRLAAQIGSMSARVQRIDQEVSTLQDAILRDPAKALQVPLLRRDVDSNQLANQAALIAVRQDIDRQYDLMKWILGTFAVGVIGLILTGLTSRKEAKVRDNS
jgi:chromosome segregation ATPase